jgi:hypothetical protein
MKLTTEQTSDLLKAMKEFEAKMMVKIDAYTEELRAIFGAD